jgi:hypothetical protein
MSGDFNNINYPSMEGDAKDESHREGGGSVMLTNAKDDEHPLFSPNGMLGLINSSRNMSNSIKEKELTGEIKMDVIKGIIDAARKTKIPVDILTFAMDWEKDMTSRSDGKDAETIAKKILNNIPQLRSSLGRDPMISEIFASFVLGSTSKVKELATNAESKPDEEVKPLGTKKDNILMMKNRNGKEKKRTNREMYDYFFKRVTDGRNTFKAYVTEKPYEEEK